MKPSDSLRQCLDDLEARMNPAVEDDLVRQWREFCDGKFTGQLFSPRRREKAPPPKTQWPAVAINEALADFDSMALQQFGGCSRAISENDGPMTVRCNYGTGILPSLFGAEMFIMDRAYDTLPTSKPLAGGKDAIRELLAKGVPDPRAGWGARTFDMAHRYRQLMAGYPKISRHVVVYHPDVQGPFDVCELLWGSSIFLDLVLEPDLVKQFLERITDTYLAFLTEWFRLFPQAEAFSAHWSFYHKGRIMLRDDSAMNVSPAMFDEFIGPYDQRCLDAFGGGAIHFCGKCEHYIGNMSRLHSLNAVNMSQPQYNDLEVVLRHSVDKGIKLLGLERSVAEAVVRSGRSVHGNLHVQ